MNIHELTSLHGQGEVGFGWGDMTPIMKHLVNW